MLFSRSCSSELLSLLGLGGLYGGLIAFQHVSQFSIGINTQTNRYCFFGFFPKPNDGLTRRFQGLDQLRHGYTLFE